MFYGLFHNLMECQHVAEHVSQSYEIKESFLCHTIL